MKREQHRSAHAEWIAHHKHRAVLNLALAAENEAKTAQLVRGERG
jgi:hypothetical protein